MYVIGTAGHVDHGKSTLVRALTGIDPDRLQEEKERGMTIDLGFAWLALPNGQEVSIVDVPGHERFIKNMLAGVGGIDLALLVVAADESVMPQTREHLAIIDLLQIRRGVVAMTKKDLVDDDWLELVTADVEDLLKGTSIQGAPVIPVSAATGEGLQELVSSLEKTLEVTPPKKDLGRPRLPIDRSFVISGFGTVVTGTLVDGSLHVGQEVESVLSGKRSRIRGLQTHRKKQEAAVPGSRVAVNLAGISHEEAKRGDVLTIPGWLQPTTAVDVRLRLVADASHILKHNSNVTFHTGSSETNCRILLLERGQIEPGESTWAQLRLEDPLPIVKDDYFVIRSPQATLGGGNVVDPHPRRHRRMHAPTLERLAVMERGFPKEILLKTLEASEPCDFVTLVKRANLEDAQAQTELAALISGGLVTLLSKRDGDAGAVLYSTKGWNEITAKAQKVLGESHRQFPLRKGIPKEELRSRLEMQPQTFTYALQRWVESNTLVEEGALVRLPSHQVQLTPSQNAAIEDYLRLLASNPQSPPTDSPVAPELLHLLVDEGRVVRVSEEIVYLTLAYREMVERIKDYIKSNGKITVGDVRNIFGTSRKYALPLLEYMDQQRVTRRVGDERVLR